jgi:hypothetical protein
MALIDFKFRSGIDKQDTSVGAENRWVDSDNVRFRYNLPEKVGGWSSLLPDTIVGVARKQHAFVDLDGNRYVAIGTDKFLLIYFEGALYDITPFRSNNAGAQTTFTGSTITTSTTRGTAVTITTSTNHGLEVGDIIELDSVTMPTGSSIAASTFEDKLCQVITVPTSTTFTITSPSAEANGGGSDLTSGSSCIVEPYQTVGPAAQSYGYGFGIGNYGGNVTGSQSTELDGALLADTAGTGGSGTAVTVDATAGFASAGTIAVGTVPNAELITYASTNSTNFLTIGRGASGTATPGTSNGQAHSTNATVQDATLWAGFGSAVSASTITLEPGLWSLSNFGQVLVATIANGETFTWDSSIAANFTTRASKTTTNFSTAISGNLGNPTATRSTLISPTTRHLIHFGTETTIGDPTTQDDMFIRFSDQESINDYTPTAINSAGTQRLQDGTKIVGALVAKENILVWTDNALYTMKFVGAPFTFGFDQVGTNCGLIGQNAAVEIDGVAYWISNNGFFAFDGTVKTLLSSVEDYVYDDFDTTKGQQVCAGINNLFSEVVWWYPTSGSTYNNRYVVYNYGESNPQNGLIWYTGNEPRTTWVDSIVYPKPFATKFDSSSTGTFPSIIGETGLGQTTYFEHEVGTDQINPDGTTTAIASNIKSYDFDLDVKGSGEFFLAMRRILPNFKVLTGNAVVTVGIKNFPAQSDTTSTYSPFTITSSTEKIDTRARGRFANIKIANTGTSESWRFGTVRIDLQPDGRR